MHNLFFQEHNRIAKKLFDGLKDVIKNEAELDEIVYQETRRLVVAEIQHVTYNAWLPHVRE